MKKFGFQFITAMFIAIFIFITIIAIVYKEIVGLELYAPLLTIITASYGYIFSRHQLELHNKINAKTEAYDKYIEAVCNYKYRNDDEINRQYESARGKLAIYANDDTVKLFQQIVVNVIPQNQYNVEDPISKIFYAIRKEINPSTKIKIEEMVGIDPSQWDGKFDSQLREYTES